ncbi:MAG: hypothetical protein A2776_03365 [Candidatus Levybacteria bacterium RIFCSPHIGHO2_01_FULL_40_10]|nr:MAG: hypothetical protein A2776_03365 [Candidatus Levybacteria bacterium RIFCSPHIGHO2_01_FULL_40_10]
MKLLLKLLAFFFCLTFIFAGSTEAKSFYFPSVSVDIAIQKDSSIKVVEKRAFSFDGSFTQIYWDIPLERDQQIRDVTLSDSSSVSYEEI